MQSEYVAGGALLPAEDDVVALFAAGWVAGGEDQRSLLVAPVEDSEEDRFRMRLAEQPGEGGRRRSVGRVAEGKRRGQVAGEERNV